MAKEEKDRPVSVQIPAKVWTIMLIAVLGVGGASGGIGLVKSVTSDDVSKQIAVESPYLEDRKVIMQGLADSARKDVVMFEKLDGLKDAFGEARTERRLMKQSIDQIKEAVVKQ